MTAGYIGNRHPRLGRFLQNRHLLIRRIPTTALDTRKNFYSINIIRHSRMTRLTPSSYLYGYVRFKWGLLHLPGVDAPAMHWTMR
jgi:hypothetical protein